jgi:hypothetical protein
MLSVSRGTRVRTIVVIDLGFVGASACVCVLAVDRISRRSACRALITNVFASIDGIVARGCQGRECGVLHG